MLEQNAFRPYEQIEICIDIADCIFLLNDLLHYHFENTLLCITQKYLHCNQIILQIVFYVNVCFNMIIYKMNTLCLFDI